MQSIHLPASTVNPYNRLLASSLDSAGIQCDLWLDATKRKNPRRLLTRLRASDLVHWHWLQSFYQGRGWITFGARSVLFASVMAELRARSIPQVVTVHNLLPHERAFEPWHRRMAKVVGRLADRLIVHHTNAIEPVASLYGARQKIVVIPHPDYGDPVETGLSRDELRRKWGMVGFANWAIVFGGVRRYKQIERVVAAAHELAQCGIGIVVAGVCSEASYESELKALEVAGVVRWHLRRLDESELSELLRASDVALMPYADSLTSGAAHLAVGHGLPIVCSEALAFGEFIERRLASTTDFASSREAASVVAALLAGGSSERQTQIAAFRSERSIERVGAMLANLYGQLLPARRVARPECVP